MPPLNALLAFETSARCGRMTLAAQELSVTPGAVSRQVTNLEDWLEIPLFEGTKNNPVLTEAGQVLLPQLRAAFDQIEQSIKTIMHRENTSIHVACYNTFAAKWLMPRLHEFSVLHPDINVHLSATMNIDRQRLQQHDVVILAEAIEEIRPSAHNSYLDHKLIDKNVQQNILFPEWIGPVMSPLLKMKTPLIFAHDILQEPLLRTTSRTNAWHQWAALAQINLKTATWKHDYPHYFLSIEAALRGLGICMAPWHLVTDDVNAQRLLAPLGFVKTGLQYIALSQINAKPVVQIFCNWLQQTGFDLTEPIAGKPSNMMTKLQPSFKTTRIQSYSL